MEQWILDRFAELAWHPWKAYGLMVVLLVSASFGQPLPEEVSLIAAGLLSFMAAHPADYPPPYPGAVGVDVHLAAVICFVSVLGADLLVFWLGRRYGAMVLQWKLLRRFLSPERLERVTSRVRRRGYIAAGLFRFTPGLRFPGFFACGMLGLSVVKFTLADGLMAVLTVPTQIYLVAIFGERIIHQLKHFNGVLAVLALLFVGAFVAWHLWQRRRDARAAAAVAPLPDGYSSRVSQRSANANEPSGESSSTR
ncbi:MAG: DedA family protein [Planctomycetes bacterium]|nr:DedA family protein [Planctomycetota bacterium]MBI3844265.1 DedA family protein [Planctomycetota bacterium]